MIIEVDEYKKQIPGYDPEKSELFHTESAKLADKDFEKHLKSGKYKEVIFMAGGTASGKTEFAFSYLIKEHQLVYDGTLKNLNGFNIKTRNIKRYTKNNPKIKVVFVLPEYWISALGVFLSRERKMELKTFFMTHSFSAHSVSEILKNTNHIVDIYVSSFNADKNKLRYAKLTIPRKQKIKILENVSDSIKKQAQNFGIDL